MRTRRSRYGNSEPISAEAILAYNTTLAKLLQRLKKDAGASRIVQNYRGTGSQAYRRQLWVHFKSGAVIDLWLNRADLGLGGVVKNRVPGDERGVFLPRSIPYAGRGPEEVYVEAARLLRDWANPSAAYASRARGKKKPESQLEGVELPVARVAAPGAPRSARSAGAARKTSLSPRA